MYAQVISISYVFDSVHNKTTGQPDDHFASLSQKEMLPTFQSLEKGLRALVCADDLANS